MKKLRNLVLIIGLLFGIYIVGINYDSIKIFITDHIKLSEKKPIKNDNNDEKEPEELWPKESKISLVATGDGLLHNAVYIDAYDAENKTFDFSNQLTEVKDIISSYDIAYYNQETLFGGKLENHFTASGAYQVKGYSSYPYFNSPSEFGDAMVDIGFNLISLASNHSADCLSLSKTCIDNSYNYWASKDVVFDGFNNSEDKENKYNINTINGITYGFLNYTNTLNGLDGALSGINYLVDTFDEETAKKEISELKEKVDVIIVAMHWHKASAEYSTVPTNANKELASFLSEQGVDIILGTYSHCLQPFDIINDKTVVFYSLGNFISNQGDLVSSIGYKGIVGALASLDIIKTEYEDGTKEIKIDNIGAELIYTYNKNHKNYKVIPFSKMTEEYNPNYKDIYNEYSNVLTSLNNNIAIIPVNE